MATNMVFVGSSYPARFPGCICSTTEKCSHRQECDISISNLYKWALRVVERCVFRAAPGQPKRDKGTS
jgi:hypothetical protein